MKRRFRYVVFIDCIGMYYQMTVSKYQIKKMLNFLVSSGSEIQFVHNGNNCMSCIEVFHGDVNELFSIYIDKS